MAKNPLKDTERNFIIEKFKEGWTVTEIGADLNRTDYTVGQVLRAEKLIERPTKPAAKPPPPLPELVPTGTKYNKKKRGELLDLVFDRGKQLLERPDLTWKDYKDLVTGIATAIDKKRIEEGEASKVSESRQKRDDGGLDLEKEFAKLDLTYQEEEVE